ncbi:iron reductase domain protein [Trichoderma citrinoviride]|uniref:Iron reductase domain protein n=1 Tax=Trichoderma citrinoviride TaxID=58853 RepID=A0A2T4BD69_9HYPO|nr:iron reductase domain protein [Trichoderma citrinoviride]PTB67277.1 iron reductase domain protein [Trichoderma citrinoviride]
MRFSQSTAVAAAALYAGVASAATASFCPNDGVCFEWGVPEASAKAGSGDIFFQLKAPTSWQWIGLGIGTQMVGSQMFIMYQDGKGNVTLSTRPGANHVMPTYKARNDVELLAGSGVVDGNMVANVRCGNCTNLDLSGKSNWISAWKSGDALDSTNPAAVITQHDSMTQFQVNLAQASISSDANPFDGSSSDSSSSSGDDGGNNSSSSGDGDGDGDSAVSGVSDGSSNQTLVNAHGILMSVIFVIMYPLGSSLMPLIGKWYIHASWQTIAFLGMWAGLGLGVTIAKRENEFFDQPHSRLGVILVALISLQPVFGLIHHINYLKTQRRGIFGHLHCWYGRALMIIGIVNGGLGLQLGNVATRYIIAYSVVAGVTTLFYLASIAFGWTRTRRNQNQSKQVEQSS